jgi:MerR family transcriptional regulator, light-induced transcriptional regulator
MDPEKESAVLRIGELSRRVGVSEHVLRAWESRYGLLRPARSEGGYRLYSAQDQVRVRRMQAHLAAGLAAAQAARAAIADHDLGIVTDGGGAAQAHLVDSTDALRHALDQLDEPGAQAVLDRLLAELNLETVLRDVLLPYLHELGERWEQGAISVGQEHFATHVIQGRLTDLARGWGSGQGPYALLACPPGERHDLALLMFGIMLNRHGWRIAYLGVDTPIPVLTQLANAMRPSLVVLAASAPERFTDVAPELSRLAGIAPLVLAGAGATKDFAQSVDARLLVGDPVTAATWWAS